MSLSGLPNFPELHMCTLYISSIVSSEQNWPNIAKVTLHEERPEHAGHATIVIALFLGTSMQDMNGLK